MLATILTFASLFCVGSLILGFMLGWFANTYYNDYIERISTPQLHPEMYDEEGNLIHSRLLSVTFEPSSIFDYDDED